MNSHKQNKDVAGDETPQESEVMKEAAPLFAVVLLRLAIRQRGLKPLPLPRQMYSTHHHPSMTRWALCVCVLVALIVHAVNIIRHSHTAVVEVE